jgi:hypothetical protein
MISHNHLHFRFKAGISRRPFHTGVTQGSLELASQQV